MKLLACMATFAHLWYPLECCAERDCHPIPCEQLTQHKDGSIEFGGLSFTGSMIRNSLDAECHVCLDEKIGRPYCVFLQHNT